MAAGSHLQGREPTHGFEATREAAMQAFSKSWHAIKRNGQQGAPPLTRITLYDNHQDGFRLPHRPLGP